jgi:hypothetical protein
MSSKSKKTKAAFGTITVAFNERDMVFQEIVMKNPKGKVTGRFHVARFYGSRDCWLDAKVLSPEMREKAFSTPGAFRLAETPEGNFRIVSVDWLLSGCTHEPSRRWLEGVSSAFDQDNSHGQMIGKALFHNE